MAKKNIISSITKVAKAGRSKVKLSIFPSEVTALQEEGFEVIISNCRCDTISNGKARQEVTISWENGATGTAKRMKGYVTAHVRENARQSRKTKNKLDKQAKNAVIELAGVHTCDEGDGDETDEEFYARIAAEYAEVEGIEA